MDGILCMDKPAGFTSFDVVAKLRGITRVRRMGHSGTLDPMATGVLPVFLGRATRAIDLIPNHDKSYRAGFRLGETTDTLDSTGTVLSRQESRVSWEELEAALAGFRGEISQLPPMYSAVRVDGKRLYQLAREGKTVERTPRTVTIYRLELEDFDPKAQEGILQVDCSKGTYIRSLCDDLGKVLGTGGVMTALIRTGAHGFSLDRCHTLEEVERLCQEGRLEEALLPVGELFSQLPAIPLSQEQARMFCNGVKLDLSRIHWDGAPGDHAVYGPGQEFLGLAVPREETGELRIKKLLYSIV